MLFWSSPTIGISVTENQVQIALAKKRGNTVEVLSHGEPDIPLTTFLQNPDMAGQQLRSLLDSLQLPSRTSAIVCLPLESVYITTFSLPLSEWQRGKDAVRKVAAGLIPEPIHELAFLFSELDRTNDTVHVACAGVRTDMQKACVQMLQKAGVRCKAITAVCTAIASCSHISQENFLIARFPRAESKGSVTFLQQGYPVDEAIARSDEECIEQTRQLLHEYDMRTILIDGTASHIQSIEEMFTKKSTANRTKEAENIPGSTETPLQIIPLFPELNEELRSYTSAIAASLATGKLYPNFL